MCFNIRANDKSVQSAINTSSESSKSCSTSASLSRSAEYFPRNVTVKGCEISSHAANDGGMTKQLSPIEWVLTPAAPPNLKRATGNYCNRQSSVAPWQSV